MKSKDIMTKHVVVVDEEITVAELVNKMIQENVSSLIVNRSPSDDTYGIVTRRDVVNKIIAPGVDPYQARAVDIMTKPILTISPNLAINHVARLMKHTNVRRMPVFDGHRILGIVSNSDIFRGYAKSLGE